MAVGMGRAAAAPQEPNSLLRGPGAAALRRPLTHGFPAPGAALRGERCRASLEASALGAPSPTAEPLCAPPARCSLSEARSPAAARAAPRPRRAPSRGGEAGRARLSSPGFCFPPEVTGPGSGSRRQPPTRPRLGACDRDRPEQAAGPAESRAAREQQPPRAGEKLRLLGPGRRAKSSRGERCAGTPRARWSRAHLAGPVAGEDNGVSRGCAPRFRFALPGRWVWMRVLRFHLPPWDKWLGYSIPVRGRSWRVPVQRRSNR